MKLYTTYFINSKSKHGGAIITNCLNKEDGKLKALKEIRENCSDQILEIKHEVLTK